MSAGWDAEEVLTEIPADELVSFDCAAFEKKRRDAGNKWRWDDDSRYELLVHITKKYGLKSVTDMAQKHFIDEKAGKCYWSTKKNPRFKNSYKVMMDMILEKKGIKVDKNKLGVFFLKNQEGKPEKVWENVREIPTSEINGFDCKAFEDWNERTKGVKNKWCNNTRYSLICYIMKRFELSSVCEISIEHFKMIGCKAAFWSDGKDPQFQNKHSVMITQVLKERGIIVDDTKFKTVLSKEEKQELFKNVPIIELSPGYARDRCETLLIKSELNLIIEELLANPFECELDEFTFSSDWSIVYIAVVENDLKIIYVGSTLDLDERIKQHLFDTHIIDSESDENRGYKFHSYLANNKLKVNENVFIIPVFKCPRGMERIIESDLYDKLKTAEETGGNVELQNMKRPMDDNFNIDSLSTIYKFIDEDVGIEDPMYVGSTNDFWRRKAQHKVDCFSKKSKNKLHTYMRSVKEDSWAKNIKMIPIELVPFGMQYEREKMYIHKYDLIENGLNSADVHLTKENKLEKRKEQWMAYKERNAEKEKERHKKYREENKEKMNAKSREYGQKNRESLNQMAREYRKNNPEKVKESLQKSKEKHKEKNKEKIKQYYEANRDEINLKKRERRALKKANAASTSTDNQ